MITEIGITAGEVWHYLDKHNRVSTLSEMLKGIDKKRDTILMSIGWLAREGHVLLEPEGDDYRVTLRR